MIKLKGILKLKWKHGANIVSEEYWDTLNSIFISKTETFLQRIMRCLFLALKLVKSRIIKSIKRIIYKLNVNNLLLKLTFSYFHNLLKPILNHVIK